MYREHVAKKTYDSHTRGQTRDTRFASIVRAPTPLASLHCCKRAAVLCRPTYLCRPSTHTVPDLPLTRALHSDTPGFPTDMTVLASQALRQRHAHLPRTHQVCRPHGAGKRHNQPPLQRIHAHVPVIMHHAMACCHLLTSQRRGPPPLLPPRRHFRA